jgi:hypothetical protein
MLCHANILNCELSQATFCGAELYGVTMSEGPMSHHPRLAGSYIDELTQFVPQADGAVYADSDACLLISGGGLRHSDEQVRRASSAKIMNGFAKQMVAHLFFVRTPNVSFRQSDHFSALADYVIKLSREAEQELRGALLGGRELNS